MLLHSFLELSGKPLNQRVPIHHTRRHGNRNQRQIQPRFEFEILPLIKIACFGIEEKEMPLAAQIFMTIGIELIKIRLRYAEFAIFRILINCQDP